ncbi:cysteine hydrolase family protein [Bradyrhizobium retamae]|uniref:Cysteine hydrolase n=1 Tax=Bradyrhizobium retamae TaxID=1300035 RepID=A0A0R3NFY9_9BRAD|nr:cysteine hydrolase [Bradyrhizobium retamae]KRR29077.1 cysteine hydrolase [Bradyrhizobium retamae]
MEEIRDAAHLCIDMQNIFAKGGVWETPWMEKVLPVISQIAARYQERTVFTRFITPERPEDRRGQWRVYFTKWERATRRDLAPRALDIVPALARYSPPALVVDKPAYSAFFGSRLGHLLVERHVGTVVVSGAETDVCVLATVLGAVDLGFRVVIVQDALCSSSDTGHDALMTMYRTRFSEQIELVSAAELFDMWRPD